MSETDVISYKEHELVFITLKNSLEGKEIKYLEPRYSLFTVGSSGNGAIEFQAQIADENGDQTVHFFAKHFRGSSKEVEQAKVIKEVEATNRVNSLLPGIDLTYRVIGYSEENALLLTETIPGSGPLSAFIIGASDEARTAMISDALSLLSFVHKNGIIHGDSLLRNFSLIPESQMEDPSGYRGVKIIDFEAAVFEEDVPTEKFESLMKRDVTKLLISIFQISGSEESENMQQIKEMKEYYLREEEDLNLVLEKAYGQAFASHIKSEMKHHIDSL